MTDIGSSAPRRRLGYAMLAVGPVAAAGVIAMFMAAQPAIAATPPPGLGSVGSLPDLGSVGNLAGLGSVGNLAGLGSVGHGAVLNGIANTAVGPKHHRHHGNDDCGCASPSAVPTRVPSPTPTGPEPKPAPVPTPVGNTFPVTG